MPSPKGYATIVDPDLPTWERDSITCGHCSGVVFVKPGAAATVYLVLHRDNRWTEEPGAFCRLCMKPVCLRCHDVGTCTPLDRWLEIQEGRRSPSAVSVTISRTLHMP